MDVNLNDENFNPNLKNSKMKISEKKNLFLNKNLQNV